MINGLSILQDTIVEPHYKERGRHKLLRTEMKDNNIKIGIGIDCATAVSFEKDEFPEKLNKIGRGNFELIVNNF